jgi:hypothetical protein
VRGLRSRYGALDASLRRHGDTIEVSVAGVQAPPGGVVVALPGVTKAWRATENGASVRVTEAGEVRLRRVPATLRLVAPVERSRRSSSP